MEERWFLFMGLYLNPGNEGFFESVSSQIYVDKTELIQYTNQVFRTKQKFLCVSRPRRFGKSMAAEMLAAYYQRNCDSQKLFANMNIAKDPSFPVHLNRYNTIFLNMQDFFSRTHNIDRMCELFSKYVLRDLLREYPDLDYLDQTDLIDVLQEIYREYKIPFVFIIDEWDCIFRENKNDMEAQKKYLDFLRNLLKDRNYVGLTYMTGILPIKKYGSHSALNMFDEFSMTNPGALAEYVGFTENEVKTLCKQFDMSFHTKPPNPGTMTQSFSSSKVSICCANSIMSAKLRDKLNISQKTSKNSLLLHRFIYHYQ